MLKDFEVLCPTSGDKCPARVKINQLYLGNQYQPGVDHDTRSADRIKGEARNYEIVARAVLSSCQGVTEIGTCPTRESMDASRARQTVVSKIRTIVRRLTSA